jgi:predicted nucleic acid-binding protein
VNADSSAHAAVLALFTRRDFHFIVPAVVLCEAFYIIGSRFGPRAEAGFIKSLARHDVVAPTPDDLIRMAELVEQYADFPLGGSDAAVIALAERLGTNTIVTLDRRHFSVVRPRHVERFSLLPD